MGKLTEEELQAQKAHEIYKTHDGTMNSLDWSLENATGLDWSTMANTKEYQAISSAVWNLISGNYTKLDEDDE